MTPRASDSELSELHGLVAQHLSEKIKSGEATAADVNAAIKFLKDNGIDCVPGTNPDMHSLLHDLPSYEDQAGEGGIHPAQ